MRWVSLALLLVAAQASPVRAQCLPPACVNNIAGKVFALADGPPVVLAQASPGPFTDPRTAYLMWDFDPTELVLDATAPPGSPPILAAPTPAAAAALTYRALGNFANQPIVIPGVTCAGTSCRTPPLATFLPELLKGGTFPIYVTRAGPPRFLESVASNPVTATTLADGAPVPIACVVSEWAEWSPWAPISSTLESQHRNRTVIMPAANGGAPCPFLTETSTRNITTAPPVKTCPYMAPTSTVFQTRNVGDVIEGNNYSPLGRGTRMDQLFAWGFEVTGYPINSLGTAVHLKATCRGLP